MFWHASVHPSVCPHLGGGTPARSRWGGGYPSQVHAGGYPDRGYPNGGIPTGGCPRSPPLNLARGYPMWGTLGTPIQTWQGIPWWGVPHQGRVPQWGVPQWEVPGYPHRTWQGVPWWGVPHRVVLDTPRSVCLLRSRRRIFFVRKGLVSMIGNITASHVFSMRFSH